MKPFWEYLLEHDGDHIAFASYNLTHKYQEFNHLYFGGALPSLPITWESSKKWVGITRYTWSTSTGEIKPGTLNMAISTTFKRTERSLDQTLLHEMVHVWCAVNGMHKENHGPLFRSKNAEIERQCGFPLPVTDSVNGLELAGDQPAKEVGVILVYDHSKPYVAAALVGLKTFKEEFHEIYDFWFERWQSIKSMKVMLMTAKTPLVNKFPIQRVTKRPSMFRLTPSEAADLTHHGDVIEVFGS